MVARELKLRSGVYIWKGLYGGVKVNNWLLRRRRMKWQLVVRGEHNGCVWVHSWLRQPPAAVLQRKPKHFPHAPQ